VLQKSNNTLPLPAEHLIREARGRLIEYDAVIGAKLATTKIAPLRAVASFYLNAQRAHKFHQSNPRGGPSLPTNQEGSMFINKNGLKGFALKNAMATHCPHGHEYTEANTTRGVKGERLCRKCLNKRTIIRRRNKKQREAAHGGSNN